MIYIFLLSGDYIDLAKEEIISLFDFEEYKLSDRLLIIELKNINKLNNKIKRLALTKNIYKFLFECKINDLSYLMKNFDWNSIYKENFCLRIHYFDNNNKKIQNKKLNQKSRTTSESNRDRSNPFEMYRRGIAMWQNSNAEHKIMPKADGIDMIKNNSLKFSEKDLAKYIWHSLTNPKVDLKNPKTKVELFFYKDNVYCGLLIYNNIENFESRKSHLRPFPHPSSLHPKLARALINLTGIEQNETLLDPFCGTGGFLIEAGLMNIKCIGYDINKIMINGCKENLKHFKIKWYKIVNKNALNINDRFDYVVTDLPYGLNSNVILKYEKDWKKHRLNLKIQKQDFIKNLENFYLLFLKNLRKRLKKKAVIVFPSYVDYKSLLKKSNFKIEKEFSNYVHRSLTRKIVLLRNQ